MLKWRGFWLWLVAFCWSVCEFSVSIKQLNMLLFDLLLTYFSTCVQVQQVEEFSSYNLTTYILYTYLCQRSEALNKTLQSRHSWCLRFLVGGCLLCFYKNIFSHLRNTYQSMHSIQSNWQVLSDNFIVFEKSLAFR